MYKKYTSYKSLWNHNKIYHILKTDIKSDDNKIKEAKCQYCNRSFANNFTVKRHESKCYYNNQTNNNVTSNNLDQLLEIKNKELEIVKEKNKELELKITLEKLLSEKCKMHPKTFSALNKILINNSLTNSNNINSNNINLNNIINYNNNYNIIGFGYIKKSKLCLDF